MKTQKYILDAIYPLIPASVGDVYKYSTPDDHTAVKFAVINTLSVPADSVQVVQVNVNCYAKDLNTNKGIADLVTLDSMVLAVIDALHDLNNDVFHLEYNFMGIIREQALQMHYANLRFRLIFLNN